MARTYKRDGNGRFAGGGGGSSGGGSKRPAAKPVSRGVNRLTRDNAGKITSVGGSGATARGGRLKTAAGNKRAMQTAKVSGGNRAGTIKGKVKRDPGAMSKVEQSKAAAKPAAPKAARPRRQVTETQLGNAAKRAKKVEISRYLSESDRMNAGGKETFAKRSAASQLRAEKGKRTSQAAKAFLSNYGTPSLFGQRPVLSTKDSPMFGAKKRKRR